MTLPAKAIKAKFGGRDLVFELDRSKLPEIEIMLGEPAQRRLARITAFMATVEEIREVLDYAAPAGLGREVPKRQEAMYREMTRTIEAIRGKPRTFIGDVLSSNPPLKYSVLAQGVLAAALHGLPPDAAEFNEDEESEDVG